ncbi:helix-hairpin-helix domain-containing protein [Myxococcota bacterium]|nr:helix-hairpin-helix domain-containing protein [Myxococcota bacterium]
MRGIMAVLAGLWILGTAFGTALPGASAREAEGGGLPNGMAAGTSEAREAAGVRDDRVAVNRADADQLMRLPGIGPKKARALIEARDRRPFRRPSDLRRVKGFGPKTILRLAPLLSFE